MRLLFLACCLCVNPALAAQNPPGDSLAMAVQPLPAGSRDRGAPNTLVEWWRLRASLADREGRPWQLEWTLYRQKPGAATAENGARGQSMSLAHAAIVTPDGVYHERRFSRREPLGTVSIPARDAGEWEWVSRGEALFPARLSFGIGNREVIFLLESIDTPPAVDIATDGELLAGIRHYLSQPRVRVRGFVDQGADKTYLRGQGRFDREWHAQALAGDSAGRRYAPPSLIE